MPGRADDNRLRVCRRTPRRFCSVASAWLKSITTSTVAIRLLEVVALIRTRPRSRSPVRLRGALDRLPHAARGADQQHADGITHCSARSNASQSFPQARFVRRRHLAKRQAHFARHQAAPGQRRFHRNRIRFDKEIFKKPRRAAGEFFAQSACRHPRNARTNAHTSAGSRFEATLTTPTAPAAMKGSVSPSSPLRTVNSSGIRDAQIAHAFDAAARFLDRRRCYCIRQPGVQPWRR